MSNAVAPNVNTLWARVIVDELARCGLRHVCISPGSRSTPLVVQFAEHPDIDDVSIIDERSASFFALGLAQSTGRPVALLCTSGTATANYFPAVCEASQAGIPLVVLTADRPPELHDCGASQAMDQLDLYGSRVRWFHQLAQPEAAPDKLRYARSLACRAFARAAGPQPGPVHLNVPFRKPLEPIEVDSDHRDYVPPSLRDDAPLAVDGRPDGRPFLAVATGRPTADDATVEAFAARVADAQRPLILAGANPRGESYREALRDFAGAIGAPIVAEPTSGLRHWSERGSNVVSTGDFLMASALYEQVGAPDLVIRTGRAPLLWSSQALVRRLAGVDHVVVSPNPELADPDHLVGWQIACDERALFLGANTRCDAIPGVDSPWLMAHRAADETALQALHEQTTNIDELCAPRVWTELAKLLPDRAGLFVSNSMPIRNLDTFLAHARQNLKIHFNRGINGIDGIVSTGFGVAAGRRSETSEPTVIVTGDVALRHDVGSLLLAAELGLSATIVVVDNDGGGIFEYLPIARFQQVHEQHFATTERTPIDRHALAGVEVVEFVEPGDWAQFRAAVEESLSAPRVQIVRVCTDRRGDKERREQVRAAVAERVNQSLADRRN